MTLLVLVIALAVCSPFLFGYIERLGSRHHALTVVWLAVMALCVAVPVLVVVVDWRTTIVPRMDVPLPLLVLLPATWGIWLRLRRPAENRRRAL